MVKPAEALPGRSHPVPLPPAHAVLGTALAPPFPAGCETAIFAMGCFWGGERKFWTLPGIHTTAVGYTGGYTPNPTYDEVCSGRTGHAEAVLVAFQPAVIDYAALLTVFWESHDPTQGMRQGNDIGTQYRSGLFVFSESQKEAAESSRLQFQERLCRAGFGPVTTEIVEAGPFFYAEVYHQQYLAKNPDGYCGLGGTGIKCSTETS
ncbi:MAG TPA: peptide-methionine (S)-S-oxide reductase MsrA [Magnetospirillum sp.]|nr:peptide-methionine (S)-S-oxide reductase MsrA [Magnetospirillum sp.]